MGYRFYMQKENEALARAHEARLRKNASYGYMLPWQEKLKEGLTKLPKDKQGFAQFLVFAKKLSPKQETAGKRLVIQMEKVK